MFVFYWLSKCLGITKVLVLSSKRGSKMTKNCVMFFADVVYFDQLWGAAGTHKLVEIQNMPKPHMDCSISLVL